ncbi:hypothetical protein [Bradyrhizobium sp. 2TAF24]|uniref:hypothetical protein n=1 Tax=Bradyrhizobium sp. 2TAF24 TaxID=3233011 RepID=UPI003F915E97
MAYWMPLIVLFSLSLGLAVLERLPKKPSWGRRLLIPPFYCLSLPVATLIAGAEFLVWVGCLLGNGAESGVSRGTLLLAKLFMLIMAIWLFPQDAIVLAIFGYVFLAAMTFSGYMMIRALVDEQNDWRCPESRSKNCVEALLLSCAFIFVWSGVRYVIVS